ncbi:MAG: signal peptidase II [Polyangiaceae bacterium]
MRALAGPDLRRTGKELELIPGHLKFIFAQNPGGAWSFLREVPDGLRRPFFLFVSSAAIVFIVRVYRRLDRRQWAMRWGLPLALGGAIGNLADRVRYGWVVDFIDVFWKGKANEVHWPTFNVADIAIVIGVLLMALDLNLLRKMKDTEPDEEAGQPASEAAWTAERGAEGRAHGRAGAEDRRWAANARLPGWRERRRKRAGMSDTSKDHEAGERDEERDGEADASNDAPEIGESEASSDEKSAAGDDGADEKSAAGDDDGGDDAGEEPSAEGGADDDVVVAAVAPEVVARPSYVFLAVVTVVGLALDLGTKIWAERRFEGARGADRELSIWEGHIALRLAKNPGGAWGLLGNESPALRISFFVAISIIAVVFILWLYRKTERGQKALTWGLPLVLSGALGNLVDRIRYGHVIDFIRVHIGTYEWPTFNVADIAIVVGVGLMAIDMFTPRKNGDAEPKSKPKAKAESASATS